MNTEQSATPTKRQSVINRTAVKAFALKVSKERRAGKFTRVSEDFLTQVEADVEAAIRSVGPAEIGHMPQCLSDQLITGEALRRIREKLNEKTYSVIASRVLRHPSLGITLKD